MVMCCLKFILLYNFQDKLDALIPSVGLGFLTLGSGKYYSDRVAWRRGIHS
jgi:hypothetical protein